MALGACDDGGAATPADTVGDTSPSDVAPVDRCEDAPVLSWDNFGRGFLVENCQPCHASTSPNRHKAPEDVVFDTPEDVAALRVLMLVNATGADPEMPPAGGVSSQDRALLEAWLRCDPALRE